MAAVTYVCNSFKQLRIGPKVKFEGGAFTTDDEDLQRLVERNDLFGSSIHFQDDPTPAREKEKRELEANNRAREDQRLLDEMEADEKAKAEAKEKAEKEASEKAQQAARDKILADAAAKGAKKTS